MTKETVTIATAMGITREDKFNMEHRAYYQKVINFLGYEQVKECVPYSVEEIRKALPKDKHLNNLPMKKWDWASGFNVWTSKWEQIVKPVDSPLRRVLRRKGINCYSNCDGVCILKECARMMAEEESK